MNIHFLNTTKNDFFPKILSNTSRFLFRSIGTISQIAFICFSYYLVWKYCFREMFNRWFAKRVKQINPNESIRPRLIDAKDRLSKKVLQQTWAIETVTNIINSRFIFRKNPLSSIENPQNPFGNFIFMGPTGVGKTALAKALSHEIFGRSEAFITFDMTNFRQDNDVTRLIGAPPGYVGCSEGGQMTEAIKRNPYSVVLLDEIDKANPKILKTLLRVLDTGIICDSRGKDIDCSNVIFILTTNLGAKGITEGFEKGIQEDQIIEKLKPAISRRLGPEFAARLRIIPFRNIGKEILPELIEGELQKIKNILQKTRNISFKWDKEVLEFIKAKNYDFQFGVRNINQIVEEAIGSPVSKKIIHEKLAEHDEMILCIEGEKIQIVVKKLDNPPPPLRPRRSFLTRARRIDKDKAKLKEIEEALKNSQEEISKKILQQPYAVSQVIDTLMSRLVLKNLASTTEDQKKPLGNFLFIGPTGVGKTELARTIAAKVLKIRSLSSRLI